MTARAIFISGGGSGIGRATAQFFAARGWTVGLGDLDEAGMAETARLSACGPMFAARMDVRDRAQWGDALARFAAANAGRLDVLFNNAGVGHAGAFEMMDPAKRDLVIDVNVKGVIYGAEAALPYLKTTPGACVLSTCSAAGLYAGPGMSVYAASKFAVRALTDSWDAEWQDIGVRARSIMPSFIDTPLLDAVAAGSNLSGREHVQALGLEFTPVERVAEAAWAAVHGRKRHVVVGKTARRVAFLTRWAPGLMARLRPKNVE